MNNIDFSVLIPYLILLGLFIGGLLLFIFFIRNKECILDFCEKEVLKTDPRLWMLVSFTFWILAIISLLAFNDDIFSLSMFAIGLGTISLGLGIRAVLLSKDSDRKMKAISNATFMEAIINVENLQFTYQQNYRSRITRGITVWRSFRYLQLIDVMKDYADDKYHKIATNLFRRLLYLFPWHFKNVQCEEVKHFLFMFLIILRLQSSEDRKDELIKHLETVTNIPKGELSNTDYIRIFKRELNRYNSMLFFNNIRDELRERIILNRTSY